MRQKRAKAYRKLMHVYCMSFGFRQPYQVLCECFTGIMLFGMIGMTELFEKLLVLLYWVVSGTSTLTLTSSRNHGRTVDSEMCQEAVASKIDLTKQLTNVLQGDVKPMITQCSIHSLYLSGRSAQPAVDLAKMFERRRCNHREAKPEEDCVRDVVGASNTHRYVLAAQSPSLRQHVRQVPGTPIVHVKRSVMVLEPASEASEKAKSAMEEGHMRPTQAESSAIASSLAPQKKDGTVDVVGPPKKKPKGPKGPNPLSVKKKKAKDDGRTAGVSRKGKEKAAGTKRGRGRKTKTRRF
ncbi:PIN domain-like protein [Phellopilus nigrolimitatus]|nr:PIN domain-like protein [Phellopilus nigrolimitatus]